MRWITTITLMALAGCAGTPERPPGGATPPMELRSLAVRVHHLAEMVRFYRAAFGFQFQQVETGGFHSQFGQAGDLTLKLVPIRASDDFTGYPVHQPGFEVADVERVIALAIEYGGQQEGEIRRDGDRLHAAVRDPDGNTIELYGPVRD